MVSRADQVMPFSFVAFVPIVPKSTTGNPFKAPGNTVGMLLEVAYISPGVPSRTVRLSSHTSLLCALVVSEPLWLASTQKVGDTTGLVGTR